MTAANLSPGTVETEKSVVEAEKPLSDAAKRALAEAEARRASAKAQAAREYNGRGGHDPARYGDWEVKGIASDF